VRRAAAIAAVLLTLLVGDGVWYWLNGGDPFGGAATIWRQSLAGTPRTVAVGDGTVLVTERTVVESRSAADGRQLWQRDADWGALAGSGERSAAVLRQQLLPGYQVLDPPTGRELRRDRVAAEVWTFQDAVVDVTCTNACRLTGWAPRGSAPLWRVTLPGLAPILPTDTVTLSGLQPAALPRVAAVPAGPPRLPGLLGVRTQRQLIVVDTIDGRLRQARDDDGRLMVVDTRILRTDPVGKACVVSASDTLTQLEVWRHSMLGSCELVGGPHTLMVVDSDGAGRVLDYSDGRTLWQGGPGDRAVAADDQRVLVRGGDQLQALAYGKRASLWSQPVSTSTVAGLYGEVTLLADRKSAQVSAVATGSGRRLATVGGAAKVLAVGEVGLYLGAGRELALVPFAR